MGSKFVCDVCGHLFTRKNHLQEHEKVKHKEETLKFPCTECEKMFSTKHTLKPHFRKYHPNKKLPSHFPDPVPVKKMKKKFECDICGETMVNKGGLKRHILHKHVGVEKVKCKLCNTMFSREEHLKKHTALHCLVRKSKRTHKATSCAFGCEKPHIKIGTPTARRKPHKIDNKVATKTPINLKPGKNEPRSIRSLRRKQPNASSNVTVETNHGELVSEVEMNYMQKAHNQVDSAAENGDAYKSTAPVVKASRRKRANTVIENLSNESDSVTPNPIELNLDQIAAEPKRTPRPARSLRNRAISIDGTAEARPKRTRHKRKGSENDGEPLKNTGVVDETNNLFTGTCIRERARNSSLEFLEQTSKSLTSTCNISPDGSDKCETNRDRYCVASVRGSWNNTTKDYDVERDYGCIPPEQQGDLLQCHESFVVAGQSVVYHDTDMCNLDTEPSSTTEALVEPEPYRRREKKRKQTGWPGWSRVVDSQKSLQSMHGENINGSEIRNKTRTPRQMKAIVATETPSKPEVPTSQLEELVESKIDGVELVHSEGKSQQTPDEIVANSAQDNDDSERHGIDGNIEEAESEGQTVAEQNAEILPHSDADDEVPPTQTESSISALFTPVCDSKQAYEIEMNPTVHRLLRKINVNVATELPIKPARLPYTQQNDHEESKAADTDVSVSIDGDGPVHLEEKSQPSSDETVISSVQSIDENIQAVENESQTVVEENRSVESHTNVNGETSRLGIATPNKSKKLMNKKKTTTIQTNGERKQSEFNIATPAAKRSSASIDAECEPNASSSIVTVETNHGEMVSEVDVNQMEPYNQVDLAAENVEMVSIGNRLQAKDAKMPSNNDAHKSTTPPANTVTENPSNESNSFTPNPIELHIDNIAAEPEQTPSSARSPRTRAIATDKTAAATPKRTCHKRASESESDDEPLKNTGGIDENTEERMGEEKRRKGDDNDDDDNDDSENWESLPSESEQEEDTNVKTSTNQLCHRLISRKSNKTVHLREQQLKKRSVGLSSMVRKAKKSDNAIDDSAELSKQKTPEGNTSPEPKRLSVDKEDALCVDNIGWNECMGEQKYYCYIGNCGFISRNNIDSLSNHLQQEHSNHPWTGYCHECDQQIFNSNRCSLVEEFDHLKSHLPERELAPPPPPEPSPSAAAPESAPSPAAARTLANDNLLKPQTTSPIAEAKIRCGYSLPEALKCMTPNCFFITFEKAEMLHHLQNHEDYVINNGASYSKQKTPEAKSSPERRLKSSVNTATSLSPTAMQLQPIQLEPTQPNSQSPLVVASVPSLNAHNLLMGFNSTISGATVLLVNDNSLKPWTTCPNTKSNVAEAKLRRDCSLLALFKCMAIDCIFTTSDKAKMLQHLRNHEHFAADSSNSPILNDGSWLECCYCEEIPFSSTLLVEHIIKEHSTSIFQCPKCFYRSVDVRNLFSHLEKYHGPGLDPFICGTEMKDVFIDIKAVIAAQEKVQEFKCPDLGCGMPVMHLAELTHHIKTAHAHNNAFTCTICGLMLTKSAGGEVNLRHFTAHGFALYNCPYCPHHCDTMDLMQDHLRDKHPTRFSYALKRSASVKKTNQTASPNPKLASIFKIVDMPLQYRFTFTKWTEAQINFMDPALDSKQNEFDPIRPEKSSIFAEKRAKFLQLYRTETTREERLKAEHGIQRASNFLHASNKRAECHVMETQPEQTPSTSTFNVAPIIQTAETAASAPALATATASSNVGESLSDMFNELYQDEVDAAAKLIVESGDNVELDELYHCSFTGCNWFGGNDCEFLAHLSQHDFSGSFECYHCKQLFPKADNLKEHIKIHQKCRFFCFHCEFLSATQVEMEQHFSEIHKCNLIAIQAVNVYNFDLSTDLFVVCPPNIDVAPFQKKLVARADNLNKSQLKFLPTEIDKLPKSQIFNEDLECAVCGFRNRVKSNLIRHFENGCNEQQAHSLANPVNQWYVSSGIGTLKLTLARKI